jgi:hypothetical protein|tara:strand:- start:20 stop:268 length:249 start_codon:yes stop_codon:yes gene_type:complete
MSDLSKLTKAQLIEVIQQTEENKFDNFKEELGLPYETEEEWIEYIKKIQTLNAERLSESSELLDRLEAQRLQFNQYLNNCDR